MSLQGVLPFVFDFFPKKPVEFEISSAPLTSDAGLLPILQFDEKIGLTERFAAALSDRRAAAIVRALPKSVPPVATMFASLSPSELLP